VSLEDTLRAIVREEIRTALADREQSAWQGCITLAEAAKLVDVSVSTLEKWGREGLRIARKGHVRRVDVAELRAFVLELEPSKAPAPDERAKEILATITPLRKAR
jgi:phage terminase Nu1 subunit (DNA packaging protein)